MRIVRVILLLIAILLVGYLILSLVGPKKMDASATVEMNASPSAVFSQISNLQKWEAWSPWSEMDPTIKMSFGEKTQGIGASYSWTSEKSGAGSLEITDANPGKAMKTKLYFEDWDSYSTGSWDIENAGEKGSKVTWAISSEKNMPFLMRGMALIGNMKGSLEKQFTNGLTNIKEIVENGPSMPAGIGEMEVGGTKFLGVRQEVNWADMANFFESSYGALMGHMQATGNMPMGKPHGIYFTWDEENQKTDMAAAFPISAPAPLGEPESEVEMGSAKAMIYNDKLVCNMVGPYSQSAAVHGAIGNWLEEKGKKQKNPVMEEYVTTEQQEPDSNKWVTNIYYWFE